ncbi:OmpA family protein [Fluviicola sp.]|jgi:outer membrane protein OmpA-like peptidoglycan-associated protein/tetratricopeptide (TPR) repeat protein|uniref:OmpA family protein n=1 Tax=Fluviicola sp. TaxID=1917219 RepID=UPI002828E56B|nr:OmpA family protein [Fluviicola sp.]MDR0802020.1 OmpA family protein [Fluviicola sp.]
MKNFVLALFVLTGVSCSTAQMTYSTKNKKAIALFEQGRNEPNKSIDPKTHGPNYAGGIALMEKALEKDPLFWEAHMAEAEMYELLGQPYKAVDHYRKALEINPNHSPTGATYYYLGTLEYTVGEYENASQDLNKFIQFKGAYPDYVTRSKDIISDCSFAIEAMKNPTQFKPVNLGPGVNTKDAEYFPTITVDGKTLLFTRRIEDKRVPVYGEQEDFYVSSLSTFNTWETAVPMPKNINTVNNEGAPTIGADGRSLIFVACADESGNYGDNRKGKGSCDLFYTKRLGVQWTDPVNLPGAINTSNWESQPSLSADGKTIYFVRRVISRGARPDSDIYTSTLKDDGTWDTPVRLPNTINTPYMEESVLIHPDGKTLYFSSQGHQGMGGLDIFVSRKNEKGEWGEPENLGYPINTSADENSLLVSADGEIAFFASDREGGFGKLDLYYFVMPEKFRPVKTLYFDGLVFDAITKKPISGKFSLVDIKTGKEVIKSEADQVSGAFTVSLPIDKEYALSVSYPGYTFFSQNFNMTLADNQESFHMDVPMNPITAPGATTALKNVFFDLAKATLRPESYVELDRLRDFLKANPTIKIEIGGHTDTRGDSAENLKLSDARAKSVKDYLIQQGIDASRLSSKGYGETMPIFTDEAIANMATENEKEKAHQENRRTEYKIVK